MSVYQEARCDPHRLLQTRALSVTQLFKRQLCRESVIQCSGQNHLYCGLRMLLLIQLCGKSDAHRLADRATFLLTEVIP